MDCKYYTDNAQEKSRFLFCRKVKVQRNNTSSIYKGEVLLLKSSVLLSYPLCGNPIIETFMKARIEKNSSILNGKRGKMVKF